MSRRIKYIGIPILIALVVSLLVVGVNRASGAIQVKCQSQSSSHTWGTSALGYGQTIHDHTYWCYGLCDDPNSTNKNVYVACITQRTSTVTQTEGPLCEPKGTTQYLISKNMNYRKWAEVADFRCATNIPGVYVNNEWTMIIWVDAEGTYCAPNKCVGPNS